MNTRAKNILIALIAALLALPLITAAQSMSLGLQQEPVDYTVSPEVPGPNTPVTIEVQGVGDFVGNSPITWVVNGKTAASGTGDNSFSFTTGGLGAKTTVSITVASAAYGDITKTWVFNPSSVNLVWEADTTVPPFYMGKALYTAGASISVYAFPQVMVGGARMPASNLSFQWKLNGDPQVDQSGLGRSKFSFLGNELRSSESVSVDVLSGGTTVAHGDITIPAAQPELVLYPRDPLQGILYNTALPGTYTMAGQEITVHAEPYFFSRTSTPGALAWNWTLNGNPTSGPNTGAGELTLRTQGSGAGTAILGASLQNSGATSFLQAAQASISIMFGSQNQNSIFGI